MTLRFVVDRSISASLVDSCSFNVKELDLLQTEISILSNSISALKNLDWLSVSQKKSQPF